jgi:glycosyltransferase involved in cell wall biosynthesis
MKVSGFTFVRNGVKYDYPVVEGIKSMLPLCDEMIVAVGNSDDDTLGLIRSIGSDKIRIIETVWDDSLREGGQVLAVETNKALDAISPDSDWAFYMQADEVYHEADLPRIKAAMQLYLPDKRVEGLVFKHINFYGSYNYVADSHKWIKKEVRIIRNDKSIRSWKDAMSFRKNGEKLKVKPVDATIYHYGWVKDPRTQKEKRKAFDKLWHQDEWIEEHHTPVVEYEYTDVDTLTGFTGTHPAVMQPRIQRANWKFVFDPEKMKRISARIKLINWFRKTTGIHIGEFKNYKEI